MGERLTDILEEATCYDCRWKIMFAYISAGCEVLQERMGLRPPRGFFGQKQQTLENGFAKRAYGAGLENFSGLAPEDAMREFSDEIKTAARKLREPKYIRHCGQEPLKILNEILTQIDR
ncbi:hypothetical protein COV19_01315 [Candidatus Woesearchaeota archaeon CG10_big_fil_rev_8_21_14_0_10_44_13]|nr:MAG: hypothetical protein COV19_01315 [Candidatus Woesearchaeota archaeon CG10_big_fil_rev_8_21_14_0_10_44_13]